MIAPTLLNNRYKVLSVLASGGFGETFLAEDTQMPSGRRCVIKQLKPMANNTRVYQLVQQRFQREAAILEDLGEGNSQIPTLYAYFTENDQFYLVQDYIKGQTLTQKLQQEGLQSESSVKEILINTLPILNYVHSKHIVHRDIKPDNIILRNSDRQPVLIDFGAVKETFGTVITASGNTARSIVIGTPGFMPMEQSVGRPVFASDIYSLGLTAIYLLTGKVPQEFATDPATGNLLWRNYALSVSPSFANILDKAIEQSPHARYQTPALMLADLQPNGISSGIPPVPITTPPSYGQPSPVSSPPQPPQIPNPQPASTSGTVTNSNGLGTWKQAVIIGGVIGVFMVGGLWGTQMFRNATVSSEGSTSIPEGSNNNDLLGIGQPTQRPDPEPRQTIQPSSPLPISSQANAAISRQEAEKLIKDWIEAKREIFAPPYRIGLGRKLLTDKAFRDNIKKTADPDACLANGRNPDDCLSSAEWLFRNNAYYTYGVQRIDEVREFAASGDRATIEVVVTEERSLFKNGKKDRTNTSFDTLIVRYSLRKIDNLPKISEYQTIRTLRKS